MSKYTKDLLDYASKLDALIGGYGNVTQKALDITENLNHDTTNLLLKQIQVIVNTNKTSPKEVLLLCQALKESLFTYYGYTEITLRYLSIQENEAHPSFEEIMEKLDNLVGLDEVKRVIHNLISYQKVQQLRQEHGLPASKGTLHLAFIGNSGTGKTSVARIVGHIYKHLGLLSRGHFLEVSRTDLIAGYQGQTALKVNKIIKQALGGVLFIDEAYSITENDHSDSYGRECLTELTKALEDYRDDLVVIVAGYKQPMEKFFQSNPGLRSRFNTFVEFMDYTADELEKIFIMRCQEHHYSVEKKALSLIKQILIQAVEEKTEEFANARLARNLYDAVVMNHAHRVCKVVHPTPKMLTTITKDDLP
ncbi:AAA family ATPase [Spirochaetales bacterium BR151]|uniref:AAA family ATPase n=1 Tax=Entomospira culicis TaxID=2719989 RepID=A0A968GFD4_9SPIO|nr:AAA family ATPase [Entomospira culicis]NIZ69581.1 AAA family ATPase [Entomospira culicis]